MSIETIHFWSKMTDNNNQNYVGALNSEFNLTETGHSFEVLNTGIWNNYAGQRSYNNWNMTLQHLPTDQYGLEWLNYQLVRYRKYDFFLEFKWPF